MLQNTEDSCPRMENLSEAIRKERNSMGIVGRIFMILISILMAAVLELNKSTWIGWILFIIAAAGVFAAAGRYLKPRRWWKSGLCPSTIPWPRS